MIQLNKNKKNMKIYFKITQTDLLEGVKICHFQKFFEINLYIKRCK